MKDKQVKKLIVEKANLVVVPDITDKIKARFNEIPPKPKTRPVYKPRRLVEVMAFSMALFLVATLAILYTSRDTDPFITAEADDSLYEAVMLSSISTVTIVDEETTALSAEDNIILLAFGPTTTDDDPDEDTIITNNVDGVRRYLRIMENVLASDETYQYQRQVMNRRQRRYALQFSTSTLADEETDYEVVYEVTDDTDTETTLTTTITKGDQTYQSELTYHKETEGITMRTALANGQTFEIMYQKDEDGTHYQMTRYDDTDIVEQVTMDYQTRANVSLSFVHGNVFGTYDFSLTTGPLGFRRVLSIDYNIQDLFQGNILISVTGDDNDTYTMVITPNGRSSFIITRDRGNNGRN